MLKILANVTRLDDTFKCFTTSAIVENKVFYPYARRVGIDTRTLLGDGYDVKSGTPH